MVHPEIFHLIRRKKSDLKSTKQHFRNANKLGAISPSQSSIGAGSSFLKNNQPLFTWNFTKSQAYYLPTLHNLDVKYFANVSICHSTLCRRKGKKSVFQVFHPSFVLEKFVFIQRYANLISPLYFQFVLKNFNGNKGFFADLLEILQN